jgi:protein required for attachment to host cells
LIVSILALRALPPKLNHLGFASSIQLAKEEKQRVINEKRRELKRQQRQQQEEEYRKKQQEEDRLRKIRARELEAKMHGKLRKFRITVKQNYLVVM